MRLELEEVRLSIVCSRAFSYEPIFARCAAMRLMARSRMEIEREAVSRVRTLTRERLSEELEVSPKSIMKSSPEDAPIWKIVPLFLRWSMAE